MKNYSIFYNNSLIFFGTDYQQLPKGYAQKDFTEIHFNDISVIVDNIKTSGEMGHVFVFCTDVEKTFMLFSSYFKIMQAAGGLVLNDKDAILMIHRFNHWDFPKGKIEEGEKAEDAAIREVMEETGIKEVSISKELSRVYHIYSFLDIWILKETFWYLMFSEFNGILKPQFEEDIIATKWVPLDFLSEYMQDSYPGLRTLVQENMLLR